MQPTTNVEPLMQYCGCGWVNGCWMDGWPEFDSRQPPGCYDFSVSLAQNSPWPFTLSVEGTFFWDKTSRAWSQPVAFMSGSRMLGDLPPRPVHDTWHGTLGLWHHNFVIWRL